MAGIELGSLSSNSPNSLDARTDARQMTAMTPAPLTTRILSTPLEFVARERRYLLSEMAQVRGLMPLIMKRRNNLPWTQAEREVLRGHLRRLSVISPYLMCFVMPGGFVLLPALAWWLDRRRQRPVVARIERHGAEAS